MPKKQMTREAQIMQQLDKQIQGMHMSDEQVEESGRILVQQQLEFEREQEWRKNLLEQNGTQLHPGLVERSARVAGHEPVLKTSDDKDQQEMYDKVTKKYEKQRKRVNRENKALQKEQAEHWANQSIRANNLFSTSHYDMLEAARSALYQARRKNSREANTFERMYRDLYAASEVSDSCANQIRAYGYVMGDKEVMKNEEMRGEIDRRLSVLSEQQRLAESRCRDLMGAVRLLVQMEADRNFNLDTASDRDKEVLDQYKTLSPLVLGQRMETIERQVGFARGLQERKRDRMRELVRERLQAGMGEGEVAEDAFVNAVLNANRQYLFASEQDEEFNQKLADQIVHKYQERDGINDAFVVQKAMTDYYDRLRTLDLAKYNAMDDEELMRHVDELAEFEITFQTAQKFGLVSEPGQPVEMRDAYCRRNNIYTDELQTREMLSMYLSKKARLLWYTRAYNAGVLNGGMIDPMDTWPGFTPGVPLNRLLDQIQRSFYVCRQAQDAWGRIFSAFG